MVNNEKEYPSSGQRDAEQETQVQQKALAHEVQRLANRILLFRFVLFAVVGLTVYAVAVELVPTARHTMAPLVVIVVGISFANVIWNEFSDRD